MQSRGICHSFTGISDGLDMDGKGCLCFSVFKLLGTLVLHTLFFFLLFLPLKPGGCFLVMVVTLLQHTSGYSSLNIVHLI